MGANNPDRINHLSHDVASGSEMTPSNKIDRFYCISHIYGKRYDVNNNVAHIMTKITFYARNEISKYS